MILEHGKISGQWYYHEQKNNLVDRSGKRPPGTEINGGWLTSSM